MCVNGAIRKYTSEDLKFFLLISALCFPCPFAGFEDGIVRRMHFSTETDAVKAKLGLQLLYSVV